MVKHVISTSHYADMISRKIYGYKVNCKIMIFNKAQITHIGCFTFVSHQGDSTNSRKK